MLFCASGWAGVSRSTIGFRVERCPNLLLQSTRPPFCNSATPAGCAVNESRPRLPVPVWLVSRRPPQTCSPGSGCASVPEFAAPRRVASAPPPPSHPLHPPMSPRCAIPAPVSRPCPQRAMPVWAVSRPTPRFTDPAWAACPSGLEVAAPLWAVRRSAIRLAIRAGAACPSCAGPTPDLQLRSGMRPDRQPAADPVRLASPPSPRIASPTPVARRSRPMPNEAACC